MCVPKNGCKLKCPLTGNTVKYAKIYCSKRKSEVVQGIFICFPTVLMEFFN